MNRRTFLQVTGIVLISSTTLAGEKEIPARKWYHSNDKMPTVGTNIILYYPFRTCNNLMVNVGEVEKPPNLPYDEELRILVKNKFAYFYYKAKWNNHQKDTIYFPEYVTEEEKQFCLNLPWVIIDEVKKPGTNYSWRYKQEEYHPFDSFLWMDLGNNPIQNIPRELPKISREKWDKL